MARNVLSKQAQILDVVLTANEAIEEYRRCKKECLVVKVDFEKAYDNVSRDFLDFVLQKKNFGGKWRSWIRVVWRLCHIRF